MKIFEVKNVGQRLFHCSAGEVKPGQVVLMPKSLYEELSTSYPNEFEIISEVGEKIIEIPKVEAKKKGK